MKHQPSHLRGLFLIVKAIYIWLSPIFYESLIMTWSWHLIRNVVPTRIKSLCGYRLLSKILSSHDLFFVFSISF